MTDHPTALPPCPPTRRAHRDEGIATSGLVVAVLVAVMALVLFAVLPLLTATERSGRTQTAADAAALAGAREVRQTVLDGLPAVIRGDDPVPLVDLLGPARGYGAADTYARRNEATLRGYTFTRGQDEVRVTVRSTFVDDAGRRAEERATAALGVRLTACSFARNRVVTGYETPTPTPVPTPTDDDEDEEPTPTETPEPEPVPIYGLEYRFRCPGYDSGWSEDVGAVRSGAAAWLTDALEPHLVR